MITHAQQHHFMFQPRKLHEAFRKQELGAAAEQPHRIKYKRLVA